MEEHKCECGNEKHMLEEIALENNFCLNALIDLLIDKKIITEEEFKKKLESLDKEEE